MNATRTRRPVTKAKASSRSKPKRSRVPAVGSGTGPPADAISIRMYRVGFGDCFLVSLPAGGVERRHILVDCGVHARGDIGSIEQVVADIATVSNRKLAIVIATHAHQDHISGFDRFANEFTKFQIGEVWVPWTWDPSNAKAVKLQAKHAALAEALDAHFAALGPGGPQALDTEAARDAVANLRGNARAIALLKSGLGVGAQVRFLKAGDSLAEPGGLTGLSVKVLGPPQSEEFLAQMDPPAGQHYLRLAAAGQGGGDRSRVEPFPAMWVARASTDSVEPRLPKADEQEINKATDSRAEDLAFALDQARNNESVVAFLTYRGQNMLFAGDAQYGNWQWWLDNEPRDQILPDVGFYKVAHHGSVNATPKDALENMVTGRFAAMVSTQSTPWPSIPRIPLMQRLGEKTSRKIVRSDWLPVKGAPVPAKDSAPAEPVSLPNGFTKGPLWFDYVMRP